MKTANLKIQGMHCDGCAQTHPERAGGFDGVLRTDARPVPGAARRVIDRAGVVRAFQDIKEICK